MAKPEIGASISEGYGRGFDRISTWLPSLVVVGAIAGLVAAVVTQLQIALVPDADDIFNAILTGDASDLNSGELRTIGLLSALSGAISFLISWAAYTVYGGLLHRERRGEVVEAPSPGEIVPQLLAALGQLMPKLGILTALVIVMQAGQSIFGAALGSLVTIVALVLVVILSVRWLYTPIIVGAGEATGDAAFEKSQRVVAGSWFSTFVFVVVVGIATIVPFAIGGAIVAAILPGAFLASFASSFVIVAFGTPVFTAAIESAWAQVETSHDDAADGSAPHAAGELPPQATPDQAPPAPPAPPASNPPTTRDDDGSPFV